MGPSRRLAERERVVAVRRLEHRVAVRLQDPRASARTPVSSSTSRTVSVPLGAT